MDETAGNPAERLMGRLCRGQACGTSRGAPRRWRRHRTSGTAAGLGDKTDVARTFQPHDAFWSTSGDESSRAEGSSFKISFVINCGPTRGISRGGAGRELLLVEDSEMMVLLIVTVECGRCLGSRL